MSKDKTWSGRFNEPVSELVKKYTGSIDFDKRLAEWDIQGSLAHAQMLTQSGVLSEDDLSAIRQGMAEIIAEIKEGTISWSLDLEDVHMNIERRLTDKIGDAGKRLHTGRSRNDQVATDIRLWLRDQITVIQDLIRSLQTALVDLAEQIKGIGSTTTATLMAMLPELGRLSHKRIASLVGIAPHPRESGKTKFKSRCFGGRSAVRKALYMATVVATRFEPLIRDFYQRLLSKGKPYKVAVTACMRKLLTILNARMHDYFAENGITENGIQTP